MQSEPKLTVMKFLKIIFSVLVIASIFTACNTNYGKEYKLDAKHSVYYKGDSVTEVQARKLAEYLKEQNYFQDSIASTVQLVKVKDTFNINFMVNETKLIKGYEIKFLLFGAFISESVFNKAPVTIQLTNNNLELFKNLGYASPITGEKE